MNTDRLAGKGKIPMKLGSFLSAGAVVFLCISSPTFATVGCSASSSQSESVTLYSGPGETGTIIREIPLGDIVLLPDEDLAPAQADGWVWVRHDETQDAIWQSGVFGWLKAEAISDCG